MPDKWSQLAAQQAPLASGTPAPTSDAWGDETATQPPTAKPGNIFTSGHPIDTFRANVAEAEQPRNREEQAQHGTFDNVMHGLGRGFTEMLAHPLAHPLDTLSGIGGTIKDAAVHSSQYDPENPVYKMIGNTVQDFQENGPMEAIPHALGQLGGGAIGGEIAGPIVGTLAKPLRALGPAMERGGLGVINHALDVTPKMMKYGQNPARGLVDEGIAPSLSKFSLANKLEPAVEGAGERVGNAVRGITTVPEASPYSIPKPNGNPGFFARQINRIGQRPIDQSAVEIGAHQRYMDASDVWLHSMENDPEFNEPPPPLPDYDDVQGPREAPMGYRAMSRFSRTENPMPVQAVQSIRHSPFDIPLSETDASIEGPLNSTRDIMRGPGGGRSTAPIDALHQSMTGTAPGASRPIYGPGGGRPFSAQGVGQAMGSRGVPRLMAPEVDTPLHSSPDVEAVPSRTVTIQSPGRFGAPRLMAPAVDTPLSDNPFVASHPTNGVFDAPITNSRVAEPLTTPEGNPNHGYSSETPPRAEPIWNGGVLRRAFDGGTASGMGPGESIGQIPGERGGLGQPQGVLRQRMQFPESTEPSPFMDMRHPVSSPTDVWKTIQNIDRNTRFNPDPEVEGVNEVRRDIRGGLRGNLEDAVPGLKPLSERYGDLRTADDALSRTAGKGARLSDLAKMVSFPTETTAGTAMVRGGRMLAKIPNSFGRTAAYIPKNDDERNNPFLNRSR